MTEKGNHTDVLSTTECTEQETSRVYRKPDRCTYHKPNNGITPKKVCSTLHLILIRRGVMNTYSINFITTIRKPLDGFGN